MSKTYVIDIDGTICDWQAGRDYTLAEPFTERIKKINKLYDKGNTIKYFTARGMGRFLGRSDKAIESFYAITESQLDRWGCKYHELILGKPAGDHYIDDKGIDLNEFFKN
tara:strand:+ start:324 stop:653 length:330 start_codon:yes stop_codon:yes gene_type:complete